VAQYIWTDADRAERDRLDALAKVSDPTTIELLQRHPPQPGMVCADVGAGVGTIAARLCDAVAPSGRVVATDIETKWLESLRHERLEVRRHDIASEALGDSEFDLIHIRSVLTHFAPEPAVANLYRSLRPGGRLLAVEPDFGTVLGATYPPCPALDRYWAASADAHTASGGDPFTGRKLPSLLQAAGFAEIEPAGIVHLRFDEATFASGVEYAASFFVRAGKLDLADLDAIAALVRGEGEFRFGPTMVGVWATKPTGARAGA
jgi:SAM-dependent methyltransferase